MSNKGFFTPKGVGLPFHVQGLPEPLAWIGEFHASYFSPNKMKIHWIFAFTLLVTLACVQQNEESMSSIHSLIQQIVDYSADSIPPGWQKSEEIIPPVIFEAVLPDSGFTFMISSVDISDYDLFQNYELWEIFDMGPSDYIEGYESTSQQIYNSPIMGLEVRKADFHGHKSLRAAFTINKNELNYEMAYRIIAYQYKYSEHMYSIILQIPVEYYYRNQTYYNKLLYMFHNPENTTQVRDISENQQKHSLDQSPYSEVYQKYGMRGFTDGSDTTMVRNADNSLDPGVLDDPVAKYRLDEETIRKWREFDQLPDIAKFGRGVEAGAKQLGRGLKDE